MITINEEVSRLDTLNVGGGMYVWRTFEAVIEQDDITHWSDDRISIVILRIGWNAENFSYEILELRVRTEPGGEPISGTMLRALPIKWLLKSCVNRALFLGVTNDSEPLPIVQVLADNPGMMKQLGEQGPTPETLNWVSRLYTIATVRLDPPTKYVANFLDIPQRTASHWVKLARERGHLEI